MEEQTWGFLYTCIKIKISPFALGTLHVINLICIHHRSGGLVFKVLKTDNLDFIHTNINVKVLPDCR